MWGMLRRLECQVMYVLSSGVRNGNCNGAEEGCFRSGALISICITDIDISDFSQVSNALHAYRFLSVYLLYTYTYCNYQRK